MCGGDVVDGFMESAASFLCRPLRRELEELLVKLLPVKVLHLLETMRTITGKRSRRGGRGGTFLPSNPVWSQLNVPL